MNSVHALDLNLLGPLHALLEEANVSRAARRAGLSQPAMSHALMRLRSHFGDPLLVRDGRGMVRTVRAEAMRADTDELLRKVRALFAAHQFVPRELSARFRVVTDDFVACTFLPAVMAAVARAAPAVEIEFMPRGAPGRKALVRSGKADLAIGEFSGAGTDLHRRLLWREPWVSLVRAGHPLRAFDLDTWASLTHVVVSPTGGFRGSLDPHVESAGRTRRVGVTVPYFSAALALVGHTDFVVTTARSLAATFATTFGLAEVAPPLPLPPLEVSMLWHPRADADPAQLWLRQTVASSVGTLTLENS
jgi:DNA-binding transcriptional LysR family regulator